MNAKEREEICRKCEHLTHIFPDKMEIEKENEDGNKTFKIVPDKSKGLLPQCEKCGCLMNLKWNMGPLVRCPIGKW